MIAVGRAAVFLLGFLVFSSPAFAVFSCEALLVGERAVTSKILREMSIKRQEAREKKMPRSGYDNLRVQSKILQTGEAGPRALGQVLNGIYAPKVDLSKPGSVSYKFAGISSNSAPDKIAVKLMEEGRVKALQIELNFKGTKSSTDAIVSLTQPRSVNDDGFLIGKQYKTVLVHLHGGGTPTAEAANGDSVAKAMAKRGIPVLALGLPGHGNATRDPHNLETFDLQAEWVLQILENLIDPKVRIVLSGHSWGGQFAVHMRRMALNPKYRARILRISRFIALAPPVDVSLKGDNRMRMAFERDFEKNLDKYEKRIAPADFDFQKNVLSNGKDSDIGGTFLQLTDMDYNTRPLTAEEEAMLPPESVIVGHADSLYVGKEKEFAAAFGKNLTVLGAGRTFKSPKDKPDELMPTGHQVFDLYIPGTTKLLVYTKMGDLVLEGGPDLPVVDTTKDAARDLAEKITHHWSNFFGFRELLTMPVYQTQQTKERPGFSLRKSALSAYVGKLKPVLAEIEALEKADPKAKDPKTTAKPESAFPGAQKAIEALRTRIGLKANISSIERAKDELNLPPLTIERQTALRAYIDEVKKVEADLKASFKDAMYDLAIAKLNREYARVLKLVGLTSVVDYESKLKDYPVKAKLEGDALWIRSELSRLQQVMVRVQKDHQEHFGIARAAKVTAIAAPLGVTDVRSANRELEADRSPEQATRLRKFIAEFDGALEKARLEALAAAKAKLKEEKMPEGIDAAELAPVELAQIEARLDYTYIPQGHEEIGIIARQIKAYLKDVDVLVKGAGADNGRDMSLKGLEKTVDDLRKKRSAQLAQWENFWDDSKENNEKLVTSPVVTAAKQTLNTTYEAYGQMYINYQTKKGDWLLQLKEEGRLTGDNIVRSTKELEELRLGVLKAKATYLKTRESFERIRWVEAIKGHLEGDEVNTRKVKEIARTLWGDDYTTTGEAGPNSLNRLVRDEEDFLANRQAQVSLKERQIEMLKVEYSSRMRAIDEAIPGVGHRLNLLKPLDQDLPQFLAQLDRDPVLFDAYAQVVKTWETYLAKLRSENQTNKDSGAY